MQARILILIMVLSSAGNLLAQSPEKLLLNTDKQWYYPGERISLSVNTFNACRNKLSQLSSIAYVELINSNGDAILQSILKIEDALANGSMLVDDNIATGNYTLLAYTSWMKNFGLETFVRKPLFIVNPAKPARLNIDSTSEQNNIEPGGSVRIQTSKPKYSKREKVSVSYSAGKPSRVSVSVYRIDDLEKSGEKIYLSQVPEPCATSADKSFPYLLERSGHVVSGKVINLRTRLPAAGINGYLSLLNFPDRLFMSTSDSAGFIHFDVADLSGKTEFVLQADEASQKDHVIEMISPFYSEKKPLSPANEMDVFALHAKTINESLISAQVQNIFANTAVLPQKDSLHTIPFYGTPDGFYLMDDYVQFGSVEELFREYIVNVGFKKTGNKTHPVIFDLKTHTRFKEPPLVLVNGVPLFNYDRLMKMDPKDFLSIGVVSVKWITRNHAFHGIIDVRLKTPIKEFEPNVRVVDYNGIAQETTLVSPAYNNESNRRNRKPDFRNVLFWDPGRGTDKKGDGTIHFYTSDLEGEYVVVVQAVTADGNINIGKTYIQVR